MTLTNAGLLSLKLRDGFGSLLYYATFCGFYDLAEHLITLTPDKYWITCNSKSFALCSTNL